MVLVTIQLVFFFIRSLQKSAKISFFDKVIGKVCQKKHGIKAFIKLTNRRYCGL